MSAVITGAHNLTREQSLTISFSVHDSFSRSPLICHRLPAVSSVGLVRPPPASRRRQQQCPWTLPASGRRACGAASRARKCDHKLRDKAVLDAATGRSPAPSSGQDTLSCDANNANTPWLVHPSRRQLYLYLRQPLCPAILHPLSLLIFASHPLPSPRHRSAPAKHTHAPSSITSRFTHEART